MRELTLLTRPGCHLCDDARALVVEVALDTGSTLVELNVDDDDDLRVEFGDMVPVVLVDGVTHGYFHIDSARLRAAVGEPG